MTKNILYSATQKKLINISIRKMREKESLKEFKNFHTFFKRNVHKKTKLCCLSKTKEQKPHYIYQYNIIFKFQKTRYKILI